MEQLSKQDAYKSIKFMNVAIEEIPEIAQQHEIEAVPTVIFFQQSKAIHRIDGIDIADLTATIKKLAGESSTGNIEDRLKALINKAKVVVFMKGDRNTPRCGFSKQLIQIMNDTKEPYETFDILMDEEVRQGLKTFSNWPTYPQVCLIYKFSYQSIFNFFFSQVYIKGELQGGLDIIKEMVANGELVTALN